MPEEALYMSQGMPDSVEIISLDKKHTMKRLNYGYKEIILFDGKVKDIREIR